MRPDMHKVIVERPRRGYAPNLNERAVTRQTRDTDDLSAFAGRVHIRTDKARKNRRELNENLSPLRRFLAKQVGRPWDLVYSEIRANIRFDSSVQMHILQHLWQYVTRKVEIDEKGRVVEYKYGIRELTLGPQYDDLYVHPETGLLCRPKVRKTYFGPIRTWSTKSDPPEKKIDGKTYRFLPPDVWYEIVTVTPASVIRNVRGETVSVTAIERKRQLGRKELRALGLRNERTAA